MGFFFDIYIFFSCSENPHSWHKKYNLLFIDNPVGTGFSYTDPDGYCQNITQVGEQLYIGLKQFFQLFPWLQPSAFFITGESFAGKYIPSVGNAIWEGNKEEDFMINLQVSSNCIWSMRKFNWIFWPILLGSCLRQCIIRSHKYARIWRLCISNWLSGCAWTACYENIWVISKGILSGCRIKACKNFFFFSLS